MPHAALADHDATARLIARVLRTLLHDVREQHERIPDLLDALKFRLARLRIRWTPADLATAFALVDSNTPLFLPLPRVQPVRVAPPPLPPIGRAEAARLLGAIRKRTGKPITVRPVVAPIKFDPDPRSWRSRCAGVRHGTHLRAIPNRERDGDQWRCRWCWQLFAPPQPEGNP